MVLTPVVTTGSVNIVEKALLLMDVVTAFTYPLVWVRSQWDSVGRELGMIWKAALSVTVISSASKHDTVLGAIGNQRLECRLYPWVEKDPNTGRYI